tara:strand:+ start:300 stop:668 length:369 start_codon:yes stop_codon:yes gene_type:complete
MVQALFEQLSTQLNFLLLSQRQMILIAAFSIAIAAFATNIKKLHIAFISITLLVYSLAVGITAAVDFNNYIEDVKNDTTPTPLEPDELRLINRSKKWVYFTYAQVVIISILTWFFIKFRNSL